MNSNVYRIFPHRSWQDLGRLVRESGIDDMIAEGDIVAVKLHFGELGNIRHIPPTLVRRLVDLVKARKGRPFVTDTTTLYKRARHTLFDYLQTAANNGFTSETMGCPILIADGLRGSSGRYVELERSEKFNSVKVADAVADADVLISLAHVTFHPDAGFAGNIKNVAMGCTTKEAKLAMHASEANPVFDAEKCTSCFRCVRICPSEAFSREDDEVKYDPDECIGCGECVAVCPSGAITVPWESLLAYDIQRGIIDGFRGVMKTFEEGKAAFINVGMNMTPHCDCEPTESIPSTPDIGIFASMDPLACDKAAADLIIAAPAYPGSVVDEKGAGPGDDKIKVTYPDIDMDRYWEMCAKWGLGQLNYDLQTL